MTAGKQRAIPRESLLMRLFRSTGMDSIAWPLRRLHCPVEANDLVLEVGSGGNPYYRANVLCDAYLETYERHYAALVNDRPTVLAYVENLPFRDDAFEFCIASHVLEHSPDPEKFLSEIQRVAKAGYIEVPDAFMERLCPYPMHKLEIADENGVLVISGKKGPAQDEELCRLFGRKASVRFPQWISRFPFDFHVRYYWDKAAGGIAYRVEVPELAATWEAPEAERKLPRLGFAARIKSCVLRAARKFLSQRRRNGSIDILDLVRCNRCMSGRLEKRGDRAVCSACSAEFPVLNAAIIDFTAEQPPVRGETA